VLGGRLVPGEANKEPRRLPPLQSREAKAARAAAAASLTSET
jgi:hypothetical protein